MLSPLPCSGTAPRSGRRSSARPRRQRKRQPRRRPRQRLQPRRQSAAGRRRRRSEGLGRGFGTALERPGWGGEGRALAPWCAPEGCRMRLSLMPSDMSSALAASPSPADPELVGVVVLGQAAVHLADFAPSPLPSPLAPNPTRYLAPYSTVLSVMSYRVQGHRPRWRAAGSSGGPAGRSRQAASSPAGARGGQPAGAAAEL